MSKLNIIGVTGCVAAGKTLVSELLGRILKYDVLDLDQVAHEVMQNDIIICKLKKFFPAIKNKNNVRQVLACNIIAERDKSLQIISSILRPEIKKYINNIIKKSILQKKNGVVLEIPLLFEKSYQKICHKIVSVSTPFARRQQMFMDRSKLINKSLLKSKYDFQFISDAQFFDAKKRCLADFVIYNGASRMFLMNQLMKLIRMLA